MNKESRSILHFIFRSLAACWPLLLLIAVYVAIDPFGVVFNRTGHHVGSRLPYNKGNLSTGAYVDGRVTNRYDSFILGSSRTIRFRTAKWQQYIGEESSPFHFDASDDSPEGIYLKLRFIDSMGDTIRNALIELSPHSIHEPFAKLPYRQPWRLTPAIDYPSFQFSYLKDFLHWSLFKAVLDYKMTGAVPEAGHGVGLLFAEYPAERYDPVTNEESYDMAERRFLAAGGKLGMSPLFADSLFKPSKPGNFDRSSFTAMKEIFDRHGTDYRIILGPSPDHMVLPQAYIDELKSIFGEEHIYDMSRFRPAFTGKMTFFDKTHFTVEVGDALIDSVYMEKAKTNPNKSKISCMSRSVFLFL